MPDELRQFAKEAGLEHLLPPEPKTPTQRPMTKFDPSKVQKTGDLNKPCPYCTSGRKYKKCCGKR